MTSYQLVVDGLNKVIRSERTMNLVKGTSRVAHRSAVGSTAKAKIVAPAKYTTVWNYRAGYVATTDPDVAGMIAIGAICLGVAALVRALGTAGRATPNRPSLGYGDPA